VSSTRTGRNVAAARPAAADDRETRERLLDIAARLFAERGLDNVTVRDICAGARANVAAVNYHFGGKNGLYDEVVRLAVRIMQGTTEEIRAAGENQPPEVQLEAAIRIFLIRVVTTKNKWIHQLMLREISNPTPSFGTIMNQVLKPRQAYVAQAVAGIMDLDVYDLRVARSVMSVQAQLLAILNNPMAKHFQSPPLTAERAELLARHIACFSIAGARAIAKG
jgi:AcrR family transcriptional regulator